MHDTQQGAFGHPGKWREAQVAWQRLAETKIGSTAKPESSGATLHPRGLQNVEASLVDCAFERLMRGTRR
jgi:hypothetical protein